MELHVQRMFQALANAIPPLGQNQKRFWESHDQVSANWVLTWLPVEEFPSSPHHASVGGPNLGKNCGTVKRVLSQLELPDGWSGFSITFNFNLI